MALLYPPSQVPPLDDEQAATGAIVAIVVMILLGAFLGFATRRPPDA